MIEVQQQALASVEKSEAEKVVVEECGRRANDDVEDAEAHAASGDNDLRAERRVAVHVIEVVGEGGVGVVDQGAAQTTSPSG